MPLPLDGTRVLDLSARMPGPMCAQILADLGAEVIKIESPRAPDFFRRFEPLVEGSGSLFHVCNRNKKGLTLELRPPRGREIFLRLVKNTDVRRRGVPARDHGTHGNRLRSPEGGKPRPHPLRPHRLRADRPLPHEACPRPEPSCPLGRPGPPGPQRRPADRPACPDFRSRRRLPGRRRHPGGTAEQGQDRPGPVH